MKVSALLGLFIFVSAPAFASQIQKTGTIDIGYDQDANLPVTKQISVGYSSLGEDAKMEIEGEGSLSANREKSKISGYVSSPTKYFYYTLNLSPATTSGQLVILESTGDSTTSCGPGSNATLTGYKGDGTKKNFCVTLK